MLKNKIQIIVLRNLYKSCLVAFIGALAASSAQAAIGISTPSVNSGELIRASDWNKVKLDLETLAAALGSLQNQSWGSSGADIFYNTGNVGIGTNVPTGQLHVFKTTPAPNAVLLQLGTTDDADRARIDEDGDMSIDGKFVVRDSDIYESAGDLELSGEDSLYVSMDWNNNDADTQNIYFGKNSAGAGVNFAELMRLTEAGDLGVGVTTPLSKLHVGGAIQIGGDASPCVAAKAGAIRYGGSAIERCDGANWDALATTNVSDNLGSHVAEKNLDLATFRLVGEGGTEGLGIDVNGTVGIGTDNPTTLLDVTNAQTPILTVRTTAVDGQDAAVTITGAQTTSTTADIASIRLNNKDGAPFEGARISLRNGDGSDSTAFGDLVFSTNTGGGDNLSEKMRILDSGAVGIGTSAPAAQLQVFKNGPVPNEIVFQVGTNTDTNRFSVDEDGDFFSDGNAYVGGGNVLTNNGSVTFAGEDNLYLSADWNNNDANNRAIILGKNGVGGGGGFTEIARFNENGRFGLNENNPANLLHVGGTETADRIAVIENLATTGSPEGLLVLTGQGAGPAPAFAVGTGTEAVHTNKFVVTNSGRVGVGTQSPNYELDVNGSINLGSSTGLIRKGGTAIIKSDGSETMVGPGGGGIVTFHNSGVMTIGDETMRIDGSGNVGIGTTNPGAKLDVRVTSNGEIGYGFSNTEVSSSFWVSSNVTYGNYADINLGQSTTGSQTVRIAGSPNVDSYFNAGNVGIGTTSPTEKLQVAGAIKIGAVNASQVALDFPNGGAIRTNATGSNVYMDVGNLWIRNGNGVSSGAKLKVMGEASVSGVSADGTGKVVCIKSTGDLGTCTNAPNGSGVCSCS